MLGFFLFCIRTDVFRWVLNLKAVFHGTVSPEQLVHNFILDVKKTGSVIADSHVLYQPQLSFKFNAFANCLQRP